MTDLISESIMPHAGTSDAAAMGRGEPGLPTGFTWRDRSFDINEILESWKHSSRESSRTGADLYLRRHYYKLAMSDGTIWIVYCLRQVPRSGNPKRMWFLYTVERTANE